MNDIYIDLAIICRGLAVPNPYEKSIKNKENHETR